MGLAYVPFIFSTAGKVNLTTIWMGVLYERLQFCSLYTTFSNTQWLLAFASLNVLRSFRYEWFRFSHFIAALLFTLVLCVHCDATLADWYYFVQTGVLLSLSWMSCQIQRSSEYGIHRFAKLSLALMGFIWVHIPTRAAWMLGRHYFVGFITWHTYLDSLSLYGMLDIIERR
ncbi:uncharacterized protein V1518DRAFT_142515 [Limtongia smithiae]|uniref:uncharacterized protein n=1 Tax=Limtongia smithiae TaxID=1125753 RepID=UPI0034CEB879